MNPFVETTPPFTPDEAFTEANRCLYCHDAPCVKACPTGIDVPRFIKKISTGNLAGAAYTIFDANPVGASCARVCPVEELCEGACVLSARKKPIKIGRLQRYATDHQIEKHGVLPLRISLDTGYRIAVIGAGPAGLSCAVELRRFGHSVTIFERRELGGGLNTHGIVPYRLSKEIALEEVELVRKMGVEIRTGIQVGKDISSSNLLDSFNAVFIGSGLGGVRKLDVPGEELSLDGLELIEQVRMGKPFEIGGNVAVIGAGNTAMDCATISRMIGANVTILYRRSELEMPCYRSEYEFALKHGVRFTFHANPIAIVKGGIRYVDTRSGEEGFLPADTIVRAIGQERPSGLEEVFGLINSEGLIQINPETGATSVPGVFAGGDVVNGGREVVHAAEAGKVAACGINGFLMGGQYG